MTHYCKFCDKLICTKSRCKHFKSITHKSHNESIMRRFKILNPIFHDIDAITNRYNIKHIEKCIENDVRSVLNIIITTNRIRSFKLYPKSSLEYTFIFSKKLILSKIKQEQYYFSKIYETRTNFF